MCTLRFILSMLIEKVMEMSTRLLESTTSANSQIEKPNTPSQRVAQKLGATVEREDVEFAYYTADIWRHLPPEEFLARHA